MTMAFKKNFNETVQKLKTDELKKLFVLKIDCFSNKVLKISPDSGKWTLHLNYVPKNTLKYTLFFISLKLTWICVMILGENNY